MNDLAEQALRAAGAVRERAAVVARARPVLWLSIGGFLAAAVIVVAGGQVGVPMSVIALTRWFGLISTGGSASGNYLPAVIMLAAVVALVLLWALAVRINRPGRCTERQVWTMAAAWSAPFVVGPPLPGSDVYTYAAQGLLQRHGLNPYTHGASALGTVRAVAAVDPGWRDGRSPYGPLATIVQHLAVSSSGGSAVGAVILLRVLAVASAVAIGLLAADLSGSRRIRTLTLTVLNPLLLLQVVSAAHLDGLMCALLLGSLLAAHQRRWALAIVLGCGAAAVNIPALIVVPAIIVVHATGRRGGGAARALGRDVLVAAVSCVVLALAVRDGLGWLRNLDGPALGHTPFAPASLLGDLFTPIVRSASFDDLATGGRLTALLAAASIVVYLLATAHRRALNRTAGYGLLAIGLLSPVLYPWYLLWGIVCLVPTARGIRRDWLVIASGAACVYLPPGFPKTATDLLTAVAIVVALALAVQRPLRDRTAKARLSAVG